MVAVWSSYTAAEAVALALAAVLVALVALLGYRAWKSGRIPPEERERRRCSALAERGKMGDATLMEIRDNLLLYSYSVRGAEYTASQDISALRQHLPSGLAAIGAVSVKYDPRNPANSIVLAETWSGLHGHRAG